MKITIYSNYFDISKMGELQAEIYYEPRYTRVTNGSARERDILKLKNYKVLDQETLQKFQKERKYNDWFRDMEGTTVWVYDVELKRYTIEISSLEELFNLAKKFREYADYVHIMDDGIISLENCGD